MTLTRYPGDVAIPTDQPLLGRCGRCGAWCCYVVAVRRRGARPPDVAGHLLENYATHASREVPGAHRGGWFMRRDGRYGRNWNPWHRRRWVQRAHVCPQGDPSQATARRAERRRRQRAREAAR